ncbi:ribonuclease H-like domain-containing protein [[Brevibacterium] frigoritolerans]|nr:ribonuclease H-like domain-containing protein [Peribacillus frigoritolerans]
MGFIAWSDGRINKENTAYAAYMILDGKGEIKVQFKAKVNGIKTTVEAEYMAFGLMLDKIKEMNLKDIQIYVDCRAVLDDLTKKFPIKIQNVPFRKVILKKLGSFYDQIDTKIKWMKREYNRAHHLFGDKSVDCYLVDVEKYLNDEPIGEELVIEPPVKEDTSKKKRRRISKGIRKKILTDDESIKDIKLINDKKIEAFVCVDIPHTSFKIIDYVLRSYQRSVQSEKHDTLEKALELLHKKISTSIIIEEEDMKIFVTGKLHIFMKNNIIQEILLSKSKWSELWKEEKAKNEGPKMELPPIKKVIKGTAISIPNTPFVIDEYLLERINKQHRNKKNSNIENTLHLISERINHSLKIKQGGMDIYVTGRFHLFVAHNIVQTYRLYNSEWTLVSKKNKETLLDKTKSEVCEDSI